KRIKLDITRIVSCKLTNGKKIMNYLRSNKDIGKPKGARSRTHGGDRKARPVTNHDGRRTRGVWGSDRIEDTGMWGGVKGGTRVGDPLGADRRRPPHGAALPGAGELRLRLGGQRRRRLCTGARL